MLKRLRLKFVCVNMGIVFVMLSVIFGLVFHFTSRSMEAESVQMMFAVAAEPSFRPGKPGRPPVGFRLPHFILEAGPNGQLTATGSGDYDLSDESFLRELMDTALASGQRVGVIPAYNLRFCQAGSPDSHRFVFADTSNERSILNNLIRSCLVIGLLSLAAFFLISLLLARWAVRPVAKAWDQQRQFVADASHELKTPLTVILSNAEMLRQPDYDPAARERFSENILTMSRQMRGLVESLLELARADNGTETVQRAPLDLSKLVSDATLPFEPLCFEKGLSLSSQVEPGIWVNGNSGRLKQAADILLDNAQKYAAPSGGITVELRRLKRDRCLLTVSTPGEPIAREDLKNIFKRFYRADRARAMDHSYGLGLSIAESIVTSHRGRIWAESCGGVNRFCIQLPIISKVAG